MSAEEEKLLEFLREIQLEQFYYLLVRNLHVTRLAHFDHVEEIDLTGIGMSKPEQRRLFDHLKKSKRPSLKKFFRKSFRKDSEKTRSISPPKETNTSFDANNSEQHSVNDPVTAARNSIQQGLKCLIQQKDLILGDFLGKGAFGYVCKGVWKTDKGTQLNVAVKCLKPNQDEATVMLQGEFIKEANAMSKLDHPNLIRLYGIVLTAPMMLVTELAPVGSLLNRLRKEPHNFMISILCSFVVQIVSGMKYLEMKRFIHRDLAARNILLVSYEKIKIGDFGLMRALPSDADYYVMQPTGLVPFAWCATECLKYRRFSHASDVWAFGVTILEIFSYGQEPWPGLCGAEILERIDAPNFQRPERPDHCPMEIYKIMTRHCWNHNPEERASFEALEKMILKVLPKETNALGDFYPTKHGELSFKKGDPLTIIEASDDPSFVKAQNRRNGKVGCIPVLALSSTDVKSPNVKAHHLSPDMGKTGKVNQSDHGKRLEPDAFSVVSRASSSSSGSNSSSEYPSSRHSLNIAHSTPKDIPFTVKRQSIASSGIGSGGPSLTSSYKEDITLPSVSESDYGSQDDSVSSRRSMMTRSAAEDRLSHSAYENTSIERRSSHPQDQSIVPPFEQSNPITIPRHGYEVPQIFTISKGPNTPGSPHLHIVSLPCHNTENDQIVSGLTVSGEIEFDNGISCSAPTTKSELKSVRCAQGKLKLDGASSPDASCDACKQRQSLTSPVYQFLDNLIYESMTAGKTYENMQDRTFSRKETHPREVYENFEIANNAVIVSDCESISYENVVIGLKKRDEDVDIPPPIPPRSQCVSENKVPLPARTYRSVTSRPLQSRGYSDKQNIYENSIMYLPPAAKSDVEAGIKLPPKTYKTLRNYYENADLCRRKTSVSSNSSYENCELNYNGMFSVDNSRENDKIRTAHETNWDEIEQRKPDGSPPPLPKKKSSRLSSERSMLSSKRDDCLTSVPPDRGESTMEQTETMSVEKSTTDTSRFGENNSEVGLCDQNKHNLIDDSPVHTKLPCKYGTIWNGKEVSDNSGDANGSFENQDVQGSHDHEDILCEELISVTSLAVSDQREASATSAVDSTEYVTFEDRELLRALLSSVEGRGRSSIMMRAQSEECPIPPPRKRRDKVKSSRRHTVGTLSIGRSVSLASETPVETDLDRKCEVVVPEDSSRSPEKVPSLGRRDDVDSSCQRLAESVSSEKESVCSDGTPLPSIIASGMELKREDSDFVDIEVEDAQLIDEAQRTNDVTCMENLSLHEKSLLTGKSSENYEEKLNVERNSEESKAKTPKTRFSKIKSLLSGKVSSVDETSPPVEISTKSVDGKRKRDEDNAEIERKDDTEDDETRYVLHFVTPV